MIVMLIERLHSQRTYLHTSPFWRRLCLCIALILALTLLGLDSTSLAVDVVNPPWDKLLHFLVFGGVAGLLTFSQRQRSPWLAMALTIALGCIDEGLQMLELGRHADMYDLLTDIAAAVLASSLAALLFRKRHAL